MAEPPYYPTSPEPPVPPAPKGRRLQRPHAVIVVFIAALLLALFEGSSIRSAGEEMDQGIARELTLAVGAPAGWIADRLPFDEWTDDALAFIEDDGVGEEGGFEDSAPAAGGATGVPAVPPSVVRPRRTGLAAGGGPARHAPRDR